MWFDKPMSSLLLPGSTLTLKGDTHYEVELGVVIGMRGRNIKPENVQKHISGYFVGLDFTNRSLQSRSKQDQTDWCVAKGADNFGAVSEYIHKSVVRDCQNVELELKINGTTRQKSNTSFMIFDIATMIADISKY